MTYLLTYSSPCQDFSNAGKQAGGEEGSGTRSSLLWEVRRAILAKKPKYLLMENVAALVSKKFIGQFKKWQLELSQYGYTNFSQVLNAKNYGVPQNRERIFMVSILICTDVFYFPTPIQLEKRLKDVLEENVEERYYISESLINTFNKHAERQGGIGKGFAWNPTDGDCVGHCIEAKCQPRPKDNWIIEPIPYKQFEKPIVLGWTRDSRGKIVDRHPVEVANCVTAAKRDNTQNYVVEPQINVVGKLTKGQSGIVYGTEGISPAICASEGVKTNTKITTSSFEHNNNYKYGFRIRKLTERECFRLMGVCDADSDKIRAAVSKSQCYKLAGNSIVVDVMVRIFEQLLFGNKNKNQQLEIF